PTGATSACAGRKAVLQAIHVRVAGHAATNRGDHRVVLAAHRLHTYGQEVGMTYESARDLPKFKKMEQQLAWMRRLRFLVPKQNRHLLKDLPAQLAETTSPSVRASTSGIAATCPKRSKRPMTRTTA
ncbi:MAG: hypothetical protein Q4P32_04965, partial [Micrococcales bacterium]|nr:hypothetical protein [Micrococcales bacterium]